MKKAIVLQILWRIAAPLLIPFMLLTARKIEVPDQPDWKHPEIQRYELWHWFRFAETPDEYLPGGTYEPTHYRIYRYLGRWVASWWWLAIRNVGHGIIWNAGWPVRSPAPTEYVRQWGPLIIFTGTKVATDWYGKYTDKNGFWAMPRFSVRLATKENRARVNYPPNLVE